MAGGWWAAQAFVSPEQRAAAATPPPPGPVLATAEAGTLSRVVTATTDVVRSRQDTVKLPASDGVVTSAAIGPGASVAAGDVLLEVNGRPVFALTGMFRFYRDLHPGDSGPDVSQLQLGLTAAGYSVDDTGFYGSATTAAVRNLYLDRDYLMQKMEKDATTDSTGLSGTATVTPSVSPTSNPGGSQPSTVTVAPVMEEYLPWTELVVVPVLPAVVEASPSVGTEMSTAPTLELSSGAAIARASVPPGVAAQLQVGATGSLALDQDTVPVALSSIETPSEEEVLLTFSPSDLTSPLPDSWLGKQVVATIIAVVVPDEAILLPSAALVSRGSKSVVLVKREDGDFIEVGVTELGTLEGRSAVRPDVAEELQAGDEVRVD